jgi:hypothetical protein
MSWVLAPVPVADFHANLFGTLARLGIHVRINEMPSEIADAIPFSQDRVHASYDRDHANRFWRVLVRSHEVFALFRTGFLGKASPVHFFWGSFDLAVTRFSGRRAPRHPGGVPNLPDAVAHEAYSHEVSSAGFWPGGGLIDYPAAKSRRTGKPARYFKEFRYRTRRSWSRVRRVIAKAEVTGGEANPRFVVTSLKRRECKPKYLYEKLYCARGEMENRIKECQLDLYADRTSSATMKANQLRLWFASMAYTLMCALRRIGLHHTSFANASCGTIHLKLLKIGALVSVSVRRIKIAMASACPAAPVWSCAAIRLNAAARARGSPA